MFARFRIPILFALFAFISFTVHAEEATGLIRGYVNNDIFCPHSDYCRRGVLGTDDNTGRMFYVHVWCEGGWQGSFCLAPALNNDYVELITDLRPYGATVCYSNGCDNLAIVQRPFLRELEFHYPLP